MQKLHIIWAGFTWHGGCEQMAIIETIRSQLVGYDIEKFFITFVEMDRIYCVTKEKYEDFYKKKGVIWDENIETSIGDDVENFRISLLENKIDSEGEGVHSFHLSLVDNLERRALETGCEQAKESFWVWKLKSQNPDVTKKDMDESESRLKFALSWCRRNTVYHHL